MATTSWLAIAEHSRDPQSYLALLRGQELPTRIVETLERFSTRLRGRAVPKREEEDEVNDIITVLLRMVENKLNFSGSLSSDQQRIVDYAHEWATETLLSLHVDPVEDSEWKPSAALDAMQSSLFVYTSHNPHEELRCHRSTLLEALKDGTNIHCSQIGSVLDECAVSVADDEEFLELVEAVVSAGGPVHSLGDATKSRLCQSETPEKLCLFELLSAQARVSLWACDPAMWTQHLDNWLTRAFEEPFSPIDSLIQLPAQLQWPSHLYTELILWATAPLRRQLLRTCRGRSTVRHLSRIIQGSTVDTTVAAFRRELLRSIPSVVLTRWWSPWSAKQRAYTLQCIHASLPKLDVSSSWLEYVGVIERYEIVQHALEVLLTKASDDQEWGHAIALFAWFEAHTLGVKQLKPIEVIEAIVRETTTALGAGRSWQDGVKWLQQHRSSAFASLTLTRLRITWWWLLSSLCSSGTDPTRSPQSIAAVLESIEYAFRRFAPTTEPWKFQVEAIAVFLEDLGWWSSSTPSFFTAQQPVIQWLVKLVRLLATGPTDAQRLSYPRQLNDRLQSLSILK